MKKLKIITLLIVIITDSSVLAVDFYHKHKNGWFWHQEREKVEDKDDISPQAARQEVEALKEEIENRKNIMIARPTIENIKKYREVEALMWQKAFALEKAWNIANFKYPELFDRSIDPVNIHAVKLKREFEKKERKRKIEKLALDYGLVVFLQKGNAYSDEFEKTLNSFVRLYKFNIEAVSQDDYKSPYFKTVEMSYLAKKLGIVSFPTLLIVKGRKIKEVARGYMIISELE